MSVTEKILIAEGGKRQRIVTANEITLADIAFLGVFLDEMDQKQLIYAENTARHLLEMIKKRRRGEEVEDEFESDVPGLRAIGMRRCNEERAHLMEFWSIYVALVKHLLPGAVPSEYYRRRKPTGMRYVGKGWISTDL